MSGTGTAVATSIILIGLVIGLILATPSLEQASDDMNETRKDDTELKLELANTGIVISSSMYNNTTMVLNTTIENTGTTVVETGDIDILLNGTWTKWSMPDIDHLYPGMEAVARINNVTDPFSVKVVVRNGISAQTNDIVEVT